jgi:hypothetical protein
MRAGVLAAVFCAATLGGCMSTRATMLTGHAYPAVPHEEVRVFVSRSALPEGCERIVAIQARADADVTTENQMIAAARRRAAGSGANALLVERIRNPSTGEQIAAVLFGTPDPRRGWMTGYRCPTEVHPPASDEASEPETGSPAAPASPSLTPPEVP